METEISVDIVKPAQCSGAYQTLFCEACKFLTQFEVMDGLAKFVTIEAIRIQMLDSSASGPPPGTGSSTHHPFRVYAYVSCESLGLHSEEVSATDHFYLNFSRGIVEEEESPFLRAFKKLRAEIRQLLQERATTSADQAARITSLLETKG